MRCWNTPCCCIVQTRHPQLEAWVRRPRRERSAGRGVGTRSLSEPSASSFGGARAQPNERWRRSRCACATRSGAFVVVRARGQLDRSKPSIVVAAAQRERPRTSTALRDGNTEERARTFGCRRAASNGEAVVQGGGAHRCRARRCVRRRGGSADELAAVVKLAARTCAELGGMFSRASAMRTTGRLALHVRIGTQLGARCSEERAVAGGSGSAARPLGSEIPSCSIRCTRLRRRSRRT
jgi:hypothetical protein